MSNTRPDMNIEYTSIRLPYGFGVRTFKATKKTTEKELSSILNSVLAVKKDPNLTKTQAITTLSDSISRLNTLKRRLDDTYYEEENIYECCKKRLLRLNCVDVFSKESIAEYQVIRLNQLVLEHMVRNDYLETARTVSKEYDMEDFMSIDTRILQEYNLILRDLSRKDCTTAFQWCQANKTKLLRINSQLELKLIVQEFIQLIQNNRSSEALEYIRKCPETIKNQNIQEIKKVMACLTFYNSIDKFPGYKYYFEDDRWEELIEVFKNDCFLVSGVTINSNLEISLQAGLSALKTENCMNQELHKPEICPVCNPSMQKVGNNIYFPVFLLNKSPYIAGCCSSFIS